MDHDAAGTGDAHSAADRGLVGAEHLTGSSEVRDDARHAVIRATLDAVNRRLSLDLSDR